MSSQTLIPEYRLKGRRSILVANISLMFVVEGGGSSPWEPLPKHLLVLYIIHFNYATFSESVDGVVLNAEVRGHKDGT